MKQTTGEFLATLRKASGFTQQEVADKLGVSNRTLSSWETDRTAPDILTLPAIADLFGVTVDEILRGERKTGGEKEADISEKAKRNLRKRRFAKYGVKRMTCLGLGLLGSLVFLAACAILLYSSAPLWLAVLLMVLGASGCTACVILLICFTCSAIRDEGVLLKEDYSEENKPYVQCVRHSAANSLLWLSLQYITGAIVFLIVFFAKGYNNNSLEVNGATVYTDYTTPTAVLVSLNAFFAFALIITGITLKLTGIFVLGTDGQKATAKINGKLLGKICCFGAIPVAITLVLMAVFCSVTVNLTVKTYFKADSIDGVYKEFQTFKTDGIKETDASGNVKVNVPAGEYYLDFQSKICVRLSLLPLSYDKVYYGNFYDLGNGFYWQKELDGIYCFLDGKSVDDLSEGGYWGDYFYFIQSGFSEVSFDLSDGERLTVMNVKYNDLSEFSGGWQKDWLLKFKKYRRVVCKNSVYSYVDGCNYDYSLIFVVVFCTLTGATVLAGTISYFVKRKKIVYAF